MNYVKYTFGLLILVPLTIAWVVLLPIMVLVDCMCSHHDGDFFGTKMIIKSIIEIWEPSY